jgi:putative tricarboxylic transport membrane protein
MTPDHILWLVAGIIYGLVIGIIPVAGATTGLITVFSFIGIFQYGDPYAGVVFTTALVAASAIGDSFASVVMNIPGANGSAATMIDGFPLARQGRGAYALSAAITTSTVNGLLWGVIVFYMLPYYGSLMMILGIPEIFALMVLALTCIVFLNSQYWFRGIVAIALGVFLGLVGTDPETNAARWTGGWFYLEDGIQMMALLSGLLAFPELIEGLRNHGKPTPLTPRTQWGQVWDGIRDSWKHRWLGLRGGAVGAAIGALPGLGGNIADWMAYAQTTATCKNEKIPFGKGNIKGVIGAEGANNAHKATAYLPTVLFGIPGAPFAAVVLGLFAYLGFELGSVSLLDDKQFFESLTAGYMWALVLTFPLALLTIRWLTMMTQLPFKYFFWPILATIVWASVQYTGGWEDYAVLIIFTILGLVLRKYKFSRPALVIGFILADKIEALTKQVNALYTMDQLLARPGFITIIVLAVIALVYGLFFHKNKVEFT